jgi:hypothetical protein
MTDDVKVQITGDATGAQVAMRQASAAVKEGTAKMREGLEGMSSVFGKLNAVMAGVAVVLAGGAAFREAVGETVKLTKEAQALGKQFGITTSQASVLSVALGDVYVTTEQAGTANNKITQTLRQNEGAFTDMGVATRDSSGHLRNSLDIMMDVNKHLSTIREGVDRNIEGQKIYGRSWTDVAGTLRLTQDTMQAAQQKAEALGLVIGERSVAETKAYRESMNDVGDVMTGIKKAVGDALLPVLTSLGNWFASIGPQAVQVIKDAMLGLVVVVQGIAVAFSLTWNIIAGVVEEITTAVVSTSDAIGHALTGDFSGAKQALQIGGEQMVDIAKDRAGNIAKAFTDAQDSIANAMGKAFDQDKPTQAKSGGGSSSGGDDPQQGAKWAARLAEMKEAYSKEELATGSYQEFGLQRELAFWRGILETEHTSSAEKLQLRSKIAGLELAISKQSFDQEIAALKTHMADTRAAMSERVAIANQIAEQISMAYGRESVEYAEAQRKVVDLTKQAAEQIARIESTMEERKALHALAIVQADEEAAKLRVALGRETIDELLKQEEAFENRRYAIKMAQLQEDLAIAEQDPSHPEKVAAIHAQLEALEEAHQATMSAIKGEAAMAHATLELSLQATVKDGLTSTFANYLKGTNTIAQGLRTLVTNIKNVIIQALAEMAAKQALVSLMSIINAKREMIVHAALAAIHAAKSAAQIPYVGWALAIGAAVAVFAGLKSMSSARGGYDIPSGVNPVTQLHEKEMVLPAKHADVIRGLSEGQGGMQGGGDTHHWNLHMIDGSGAKDFIKNYGSDIAKEMTSQYRNGFPLLR